jgi:superfamily II DNA or RNA helicase
MELREYQKEIANNAADILTNKYIVYLAMEVRTGKTVTSLETAKMFGAKDVLFLTKKKAIKSIEKDYKDFGYTFNLTVINNESLHLLPSCLKFDLLISDEHHRCATYPKPNKVTKLIKQRFAYLPMIFLSGTPHPESYSQIYHQFWISNQSPFKQWTSFYGWAKTFVNIKQKQYGHGLINDYSNADKSKIDKFTSEYFINYTQNEAGFTTEVKENILRVRLKEQTYSLIKQLQKDKVIKGKTNVVLGDTGVKLMSKLHQMYSGTVKFESGDTMVLDYSKAEFIKEKFNNKIAIFYNFKAELDAIKEIYKDSLTEDIEEFNSTNKSIALQIVSGREGISLAKAEYLIYYNIDFSALSYLQSRDRLTTMDRKSNEVFWIFSENGIEDKIYKSVMNKKQYTLSIFKKDFDIKIK